MAKYELRPVMNIDDLEDAISINYGVRYDLRQLFFEGDFMNDCFKSLYFGEDVDEDWSDNYMQMNVVFSYLRDTVPDYNSILLDVS